MVILISGVLQEDKLAPFSFIICRDYVLCISINLKKENDFTLKKVRRRQYPAETITNANYTDDLLLLANTTAQGIFNQHSQELAAIDIGFHMNSSLR